MEFNVNDVVETYNGKVLRLEYPVKATRGGRRGFAWICSEYNFATGRFEPYHAIVRESNLKSKEF
jgi:hypothetical protein